MSYYLLFKKCFVCRLRTRILNINSDDHIFMVKYTHWNTEEVKMEARIVYSEKGLHNMRIKTTEHENSPFSDSDFVLFTFFWIRHKPSMYEAFDFHLTYTNQQTKEPMIMLHRNKRDLLTKLFFWFQQYIRVEMGRRMWN